MSQQEPSFNNPYAAPQASLETPVYSESNFTPEGRRVAAGNATQWISSGWEMFKQAPGPWILLFIVYMLVNMATAFVPFVGSFIQYLATPILVGGIYLGCQALDEGDELTVGHLFAGFNDKLGQLAVIGAIYLGVIMLFGVIVFIVVLLGIGTAGASGMFSGSDTALLAALGSMGGVIIVLVVVFLPLLILLSMVLYIAPALVVLQNQSGIDAIKSTWSGLMKNLGGLALYVLLTILIAIVALIPCGLGFLVAFPVMMAAMYWAYRDIFTLE
ncbi:BPSS1780 family membrane protein [Chitinilyticum aquatile]|uniref:BPSS1780 family membrane protein n=1 Tax=Chitinilyticum aquatile TaxID=362520 RepID=UPI0003FC2321|nr:BPSS1780 family membrane protein [Chitinilyticum aquatile]